MELEEYVVKLNDFSGYLQGPYETNEMFRKIHSLKSLSYHYKIDEIAILMEKTENILFFMRNYDCDLENIKNWLDELCKQTNAWATQLNNDEKPELYSLFFDTMPKVHCKLFKPSRVNDSTEIVVFIKEKQVRNLILDTFKKTFKYIKVVETMEDAYDELISPVSTYLVSSVKYNEGNVLHLIRKLKDSKYNINKVNVLGNFSTGKDFNKFKDMVKPCIAYNFSHNRISDIKNNILKELSPNLEAVQIPDNKISLIELSKLIKPLKETIVELESKCFDERYSIRDIAKVIELDPMFSGLLLKSINTPFLGLPNKVSNINVAVSLMGKKRVGTMVLAEFSKQMYSEKYLESYSLTMEQLLDISIHRTRFAYEWLKYIDIPQNKKDNITSLMCLLPIGNIVINQALIHNNDDKRFSEMMTAEDVYVLEKQMLGYSSFEALQRIFDMWNLPKEIQKMLKSVRENGMQSVKLMNVCSVILTLSTQLFRIDGTFGIDSSHIRYADKKGFAGKDMENIFMKITNDQRNGKLF